MKSNQISGLDLMSKTTEESWSGQLMNFLGSEKHLLNIWVKNTLEDVSQSTFLTQTTGYTQEQASHIRP